MNQARRSSLGEPERTRRMFHSRAYHRHFEGYSEFKTLNENGEPRLERVYTGNWYTPDLSRRQRALRKAGYAAQWLLGAGLLAFCASRPSGANNTWYCVLTQCVIIVGLAWTAIGLFNYFTVPVKQTVGDWRSSSGTIKKGSFLASAGFLLAALTNVLFLLLGGESGQLPLLSAAGYFLGAGLMVMMNRLEHSVRYIQTESQNAAPQRSVIID